MADIKINGDIYSNVTRLCAEKADGTGEATFGEATITPLNATENGTYTADAGAGYSPVVVAVSPPSGIKHINQNGVYNITRYANVDVSVSAEAGGAGVYFMDYDGGFVDFWAMDEVAGKTALPENPTHLELIAQGWNWTLAQIQDYAEDYPDARINVGQMYKTASGKTEAYITVTPVTGLSVVFNMDGIKDWGDGSAPDGLNTHTYSDYGDYVIKCDGGVIQAGTSSAGGLFGSTSSNMNRYWCTKIFLGENISKIPDSAFRYCWSLINITIPQGVTSIEGSAFYNCYSLTHITIPQGVTSIGQSAFYSCYSLVNITIPQGVTSISTAAFYSCIALTHITIPQGVTSMSAQTFYGCTALTHIIIPQGVTSIIQQAFYNCSALTHITIPQGVTSIGASAIYSCPSLINVIIPQGVTRLDNYAFSYCYSLTKYDFTAATAVPTLNASVFTSINGICKIVVPDSLYESWKTATNWVAYANYIYKASEVTN